MLESTPLYGGNADYLEGLYEQYLADPGAVPAQWRTYFDGLGPRPAAEQAHGPVIAGIAARAVQTPLPAAATSSRQSPLPPCGSSGLMVQSCRNLAR